MMSRRKLLACIGSIPFLGSLVAGNRGAEPTRDGFGEGDAEIVWVDLPEKIEPDSAITVRFKARETTGEASFEFWPDVRFYDLSKEIVVVQSGLVTRLQPGEEKVSEWDFMINKRINGPPIATEETTLVVDVEKVVEVVEVSESGAFDVGDNEP